MPNLHRLHVAALRRDFPSGSRVELHPSMDRWMMGDRFGTVERVADTGRIYVTMDSGYKLRTYEHNLQPVA